ncbi:MAG: GNAT family N-acetyltransferase [Methylococcales bacterium]
MDHLASPANQRGDHSHVLIGERICLREVRLSDVEGSYLQWMNDPEVLKYTESRFQSYSKKQLRAYVAKINENPDFIFRAITLRDTGRHIGNIKLGPIDWNHRLGDVGFIIGAKDCWGKGYAAESIQLLAEYAFSSLKLHKLTAGCYVVNIAAIKTLKKAGFEQLPRGDKPYFSDGKPVDVVNFELLEPNHG